MTITELPRPSAEPALPLWEEISAADAPTPQRHPWWLRMWWNEIFLLTVVALAGYVAVAFWMRFGLHFYINDALNRSADAIYVTVGRDPHLAAIGFYWPPLAQIVQLPFAPFCTRFAEGIMAGPLSSAVCMALTIPVLARVGKFAGLRRWTTFAICATFAINPVTIYYAGVGMSEACSILFIAIALYGFLKFTQQDSIQNIVLFSAGLCGVIMTRLEGPFLTFALVVVAVFGLRDIRRRIWNAVLIAGPPYLMFGLWMVVQWIIEGDPLFFEHQQGGAPPAPGSQKYLPNTVAHPFSAVTWAGHWLLVLGPAVIIVAALAILRPLSKRTRGCIGIVGGSCVFLAIQIDQVITGTGFGNPRYFVTCIIFATVGVLWIAGTPPRSLADTVGRGIVLKGSRGLVLSVWNVALIAVLLVAGVTGSRTLTNGLTTHVEGECAFFEYGAAKVLPVLGGSQKGTALCKRPSDGLEPWEEADHWIDGHVKPTDRVLADNSVDFPADLFTTKPQLFIVENDRDWKKTIANPTDVTYIVTQATSLHGRPVFANGDFGATDQGAYIISLTPGEWKLAAAYSSATNVYGQSTTVQVYHFVPSRPGDKPQGTESNIDG